MLRAWNLAPPSAQPPASSYPMPKYALVPTPAATWCSGRWLSASRQSCVRVTRLPASAATNSRCCARAFLRIRSHASRRGQTRVGRGQGDGGGGSDHPRRWRLLRARNTTAAHGLVLQLPSCPRELVTVSAELGRDCQGAMTRQLSPTFLARLAPSESTHASARRRPACCGVRRRLTGSAPRQLGTWNSVSTSEARSVCVRRRAARQPSSYDAPLS